MRCDGKNINCDRRRELLAQLKCLISSMERKKPCEWDDPFSEPLVCCPTEPVCPPQYCGSIRTCKNFNFRGSIMYKCECIKRNGLQDRCMMWECMGRPECMTKLYPVCEPGRLALLKLTDLGDAKVALKKFYCADQAREAALAAYCRLVCGKTSQIPPCCDRNNSFSYECPTYPDCCTSCDICTPCCDLPDCSFPCNLPFCLPSYPPACPPC